MMFNKISIHMYIGINYWSKEDMRFILDKNLNLYLQSELFHLITQLIIVQVNSDHFNIRSHEYFNSSKSS